MSSLLTNENIEVMLDGNTSRLVVALSGGADSVALLHCVVNQHPGVPIAAIHVNHHLQEEADDWQQFCVDLCLSLGVELECVSVSVSKGGSLEAQARKARYSAFESYLRFDDLLLLGHHGDDQLETILLNLFRGSEAFGVRGMPLQRAIGLATLYRPLLKVRRSEILAYCTENTLRWVEDVSNTDTNMDRNFLRHELLPLIRQRFPVAESALLGALDRDNKVRDQMADIATIDLEGVLSDRGGIELPALFKLAELRILNLLRQFLLSKEVPFPSGNMLRECLSAMANSRSDARPLLSWQGYEFRRHDGEMILLRSLSTSKSEPDSELESGKELDWTIANSIEITGGRLTASNEVGRGIALHPSLPVTVCFRRGGEKISLQRSRTLKNVFQENHLPEWLRQRIPLIYQGGVLIAIPCVPEWQFPCLSSSENEVLAKEHGWTFTYQTNDRV